MPILLQFQGGKREPRGSSTLAGYAGWIELASAQLGAHHRTIHVGGSAPVDLVVCSTQDKSAFPGLMHAMLDSPPFPKALVDFVQSDGVARSRLVCEDVAFESLSTGGRGEDTILMFSLAIRKATFLQNPGPPPSAPKVK